MGETNGRASIRCAIYTRKSSEEGLEQEFNSLDAQRESCEAFVLSQRQEGWHALEQMYDDGGVSGATMERPALKRLLSDIERERFDSQRIFSVRLGIAVGLTNAYVKRCVAKGWIKLLDNQPIANPEGWV